MEIKNKNKTKIEIMNNQQYGEKVMNNNLNKAKSNRHTKHKYE